jgi:phosphoribosyl 1,2-cyclic phosphodiesterase
VKALLCGVRGSTPAPGVEFAGVGGNTSCVAIPAPGGRWLVLDAGTGLRRLGAELDGGPLRGSILLTHLHWDHTQGLPFLPNADRPDAEVSLWLPAQADGPSETDPVAVLRRSMSPPHFPIEPDALLGSWHFGALDAGEHTVEGFTVTAAEIEHKGGRTFGYRVDGPDGSIAYLSDHAPRLAGAERRTAAIKLASGVDVLLHDAQYMAAEQAKADAYGHATIEDAIAVAAEAGARRLTLIHHAPDRTDLDMEAVETTVASAPVPTSVGREGDWLHAATPVSAAEIPHTEPRA